LFYWLLVHFAKLIAMTVHCVANTSNVNGRLRGDPVRRVYRLLLRFRDLDWVI